jgi:intergrase/recombinase
MIAKTSWVGKILRFAVLVGLRPAECVESVRLLNTARDTERSYYYNPQRQALEHFRFPKIFIRRTKKAFISFVTPEMLDIVKLSVYRKVTYNQIRLACRKSGINSMYMHYTRKIFASWLRHSGIQPEIIDLLQGRIGKNIFLRHYLTPSSNYKTSVLKALEQLQQQLD